MWVAVPGPISVRDPAAATSPAVARGRVAVLAPVADHDRTTTVAPRLGSSTTSLISVGRVVDLVPAPRSPAEHWPVGPLPTFYTSMADNSDLKRGRGLVTSRRTFQRRDRDKAGAAYNAQQRFPARAAVAFNVRRRDLAQGAAA
jgi:hypothetical protein